MENNTRIALTRRANSALTKHEASLEPFVCPTADIFETDEAFIVKLEMPGVGKESISLSLSPDRLTVKGVAWPHHREGATILFREIRSKSYCREFNLGEGIDHDHVDAQFEHGVLTIILRKDQHSRAKQIPIQ